MTINARTTQPVKTAVISGGHTFDVVDWTRLFRRLEGVDAYLQHIDDFTAAPREVRESYDVVLFYIMMVETPQDAAAPWYSGQPRSALEDLGRTEQGIVVLHHAILAYPEWPLWDELVGIQDRKFGFYHDQELNLKVVNASHPITQGLKDWRMMDETYTMKDATGDSTILLTVEHSQSMHSIAWSREYKNSRVFCFQSGHDNSAYMDPNFQILLQRGIRWAAGRI